MSPLLDEGKTKVCIPTGDALLKLEFKLQLASFSLCTNRMMHGIFHMVWIISFRFRSDPNAA